MKRRLNILCLMVIFVLSYSVLEAGYFFFIGAKLGVESVAEKEDTHALRQKLMHMKYISLESHSFTMKGGELFSDSVYNEKTGKYVPASYSSMVVSIDDHPALWEQIASKLLTFLQIGVYIWAIVLFFFFISPSTMSVRCSRCVDIHWSSRASSVELCWCWDCVR